MVRLLGRKILGLRLPRLGGLLLAAHRERLLNFRGDAPQPFLGALGTIFVSPDLSLKLGNLILCDPQLHGGLVSDSQDVLSVLLGNAGGLLKLHNHIVARSIQRVGAVWELNNVWFAHEELSSRCTSRENPITT
jgi:hypothetical protein